MSHTAHPEPVAHPAPVAAAAVRPTTASTPHLMTKQPTRTAAPRSPGRCWPVALAAQILVVLDISVVNTALPSIGSALHLEGSQLQWLVTAYLMMSGGGLLLGGRFADLLSRRRVFLTGLSLFTVASLVSGFADSGSQLIAARAVQGLCAALLTPSALSLIMTTYAGTQRKTALAMWGAVGSLGVAAGVLLGGALTTWTELAGHLLDQRPHRRRRPPRRPPASSPRTPPRDPVCATSTSPAPLAVIGGLATLIYGVCWHRNPRLDVGADRGLTRRFRDPAARSSSSSNALPSRCSRRTSGSSRRWSPAPR